MKRNASSLRKNAERGAITTWCPNCKRKSALGHYINAPVFSGHTGYRKCRYCGHKEYRNHGRRMELYRQWLKEKNNAVPAPLP